jgi:hypothetical protein
MSYRLRRGVVAANCSKNKLARKIQRVWLGYKGRKFAREYRATLTKFALQVQRIFRGRKVGTVCASVCLWGC